MDLTLELQQFEEETDFLIGAFESMTNFANMLEDQDEIAMEGEGAAEGAPAKTGGAKAALQAFVKKIKALFMKLFKGENGEDKEVEIKTSFGDPDAYLKATDSLAKQLANETDPDKQEALLAKFDELISNGRKAAASDKAAAKPVRKGFGKVLLAFPDTWMNVKWRDARVQGKAMSKISSAMAALRSAMSTGDSEKIQKAADHLEDVAGAKTNAAAKKHASNNAKIEKTEQRRKDKIDDKFSKTAASV